MKPYREKIYVYGKHPIMEAVLHRPEAVRKVLVAPDLKDEEFASLLTKHGVTVELLRRGDADRMVGREVAHQGVIGIVEASKLMADFKEFLPTLPITTDIMLVLLDELTDPHNVGAIIRSAAAFGAAGVLMPVHNQAPITGAVVKASAGMVFRVPLVQVSNVNHAIDTLKKKNDFRAYGLAMDGTISASEEKFAAPALFVIGNEGRGIREKTLDRCDVRLRIPMHPRTESLNASVSAAIVLYEWSTAHPENLRG